jgi:threonine dehydratase
MITTTGLVQKLTILKSGRACALIGIEPTNVEAFSISVVAGETVDDLTRKSSMIDALVTAMAGRQQLGVTHDDTESEILAVVLGGPIF